MKQLIERIKECARYDRGTDSDMFAYLAEEVGEVATCLSVKNGLKKRELKEPMESELCDVINAAIGLILRNPEWDYSKILETMGQKLTKWEETVKLRNKKK